MTLYFEVQGNSALDGFEVFFFFFCIRLFTLQVYIRVAVDIM